jgi:hypothetical protein
MAPFPVPADHNWVHMEDLVAKVIDRWRQSAGDRLPAGATEREIQQAEGRIGVQLPAAMRALWMAADGMPTWPGDTDEVGYRFYPLEQMARVSDHRFHRWAGINGLTGDAVIFGDYLQLSWALAIQAKTEPGHETVVRAVGQLGNPVVAPTFSGFLDRYLADSPELYMAGEGAPAG